MFSLSSVAKVGGAPLLIPPKQSRHTAQRKIAAYKETDLANDWRVQQMADAAHEYYSNFLSKGQAHLADKLFTDDAVHTDCVWDPSHPTVGPQGLQLYLADLRTAFPDFHITIDRIAIADMNCIMVSYSGEATGLGAYHNHKPSHHTSAFTGINMIQFNKDRSKIKEVRVYRQPFAEDKMEMGEREGSGEGGFRELRLKRLV